MATAKARPKPTPTPELPPPEEPKSTPERGTAIIEAGLVGVISKAELDQQIETARRYPRSLKAFTDEATEMATLNATVAAECIYALPRRDASGTTGIIRGPSARLAEILAYAFRNCRAIARVVEESREFITAQGLFLDLERNSGISVDVKRRITNRYGQRYSTDMVAMTGNAAVSIALRNAVLKGIPKAIWSPVYEAALRITAGDTNTLAQRRSTMLSYLAKQGATNEMVFRTLGIRGSEDIGLDELTTLHGIATAVRDGELTIEQAFNPTPAPASGVAGAKELLEEPAPQPE